MVKQIEKDPPTHPGNETQEATWVRWLVYRADVAARLLREEVVVSAVVLHLDDGESVLTTWPAMGPRATAALVLRLTDIDREGPVEAVTLVAGCGCTMRTRVIR